MVHVLDMKYCLLSRSLIYNMFAFGRKYQELLSQHFSFYVIYQQCFCLRVLWIVPRRALLLYRVLPCKTCLQHSIQYYTNTKWWWVTSNNHAPRSEHDVHVVVSFAIIFVLYSRIFSFVGVIKFLILKYLKSLHAENWFDNVWFLGFWFYAAHGNFFPTNLHMY